MKKARIILIFIVAAMFIWLCSALLNSCVSPKSVEKSVVNQKSIYRVTPVSKDGEKGGSIIIVN